MDVLDDKLIVAEWRIHKKDNKDKVYKVWYTIIPIGNTTKMNMVILSWYHFYITWFINIRKNTHLLPFWHILFKNNTLLCHFGSHKILNLPFWQFLLTHIVAKRYKKVKVLQNHTHKIIKNHKKTFFGPKFSLAHHYFWHGIRFGTFFAIFVHSGVYFTIIWTYKTSDFCNVFSDPPW
jgi:hypothetical protein